MRLRTKPRPPSPSALPDAAGCRGAPRVARLPAPSARPLTPPAHGLTRPRSSRCAAACASWRRSRRLRGQRGRRSSSTRRSRPWSSRPPARSRPRSARWPSASTRGARSEIAFRSSQDGPTDDELVRCSPRWRRSPRKTAASAVPLPARRRQSRRARRLAIAPARIRRPRAGAGGGSGRARRHRARTVLAARCAGCSRAKSITASRTTCRRSRRCLRLAASGGVDPERALRDSIGRVLAIAEVHDLLTARRDEDVDSADLRGGGCAGCCAARSTARSRPARFAPSCSRPSARPRSPSCCKRARRQRDRARRRPRARRAAPRRRVRGADGERPRPGPPPPPARPGRACRSRVHSSRSISGERSASSRRTACAQRCASRSFARWMSQTASTTVRGCACWYARTRRSSASTSASCSRTPGSRSWARRATGGSGASGARA